MGRQSRNRVVRYGESPHADFFAEDVRRTPNGMAATVRAHGSRGEAPRTWSVETRFAGRHQLSGVLQRSPWPTRSACPPSSLEVVREFVPYPGRLRPLKGRRRTTVLDDSYSASAPAVLGAVETLKAHPAPRAAVLGDMDELGPEHERTHRLVGERLAPWVDLLVAVDRGRLIAEAAVERGLDPERVALAVDAEQAVECLSDSTGGTVLVKGAAELGLERVSAALLEGGRGSPAAARAADGSGGSWRRRRRRRVTGLHCRPFVTVTSPRRPLDVAEISWPEVTPRVDWGADESLRYDSTGREIWPPSFHPIQKVIVHHTATYNDDPDPTRTVRAIYRYHAVDRGWGDIGYNFLIDGAGTVYEGRHAFEYSSALPALSTRGGTGWPERTRRGTTRAPWDSPFSGRSRYASTHRPPAVPPRRYSPRSSGRAGSTPRARALREPGPLACPRCSPTSPPTATWPRQTAPARRAEALPGIRSRSRR